MLLSLDAYSGLYFLTMTATIFTFSHALSDSHNYHIKRQILYSVLLNCPGFCYWPIGNDVTGLNGGVVIYSVSDVTQSLRVDHILDKI